MAVTERGRIWQKMRGTAQRCLVVGLGMLPGMSVGQLQSILAHEYGHFSNRDTAGGNLAHQVHASVNTMAMNLGWSGQARWFNPAWLFVNGFIRLFLRITLGASRLQEIMADRHAAMAYGVGAFVSALEHIVRQGVLFRMQVEGEIDDARDGHRDLHNLYDLPALQSDAQQQELADATKEAMERPTSPYSSHPAPRDRIALLNTLQTSASLNGDRAGPAWSLLADPDGLQAEMSAAVQAVALRSRRSPDHDADQPPDAGQHGEAPGAPTRHETEATD